MTVPSVLHCDITVDEENPTPQLEQIIKRVRPNWNDRIIQFKTVPKGAEKGIVNTMVICFCDEDLHDAVMFRVYNSKFSDFANRERETESIKLIYELYGFAPNILMTVLNGFCYDYIHGEIMSKETVRLEETWKIIAKQFALWHSTPFSEENKKLSKFQEFYITPGQTYPDEMKDPKYNQLLKKELPTAEIFFSEIHKVRARALSLGSPFVFCHGDTKPENMIWNKNTGEITFVDFETTGFSYQAFEIAYHFWRFAGIKNMDYTLYPDRQFQIKWLKLYLEVYYQRINPSFVVEEKDVEKLYVQVNTFFLLFLICSVGSIRYFNTMDLEGFPFDLMKIAIDCYKEYCLRRDDILSLEMPE